MKMMKAAKRRKTREEGKEEISAMEIVFSNDDLLIEIFQRLPLKPCICFSLVCKQWKALLGNLDFRNCTANGFLFFSGRADQVGYIPFSTDNNDKSVITPYWPPVKEILESCNGLLLCRSCEYGYYVYNPTTKKFSSILSLPPDETSRPRHSVFDQSQNCWSHELGVNLVFDPQKSPYYKAVHAKYDYETKEIRFYVYSSENGVWTRISEKFRFPCREGVPVSVMSGRGVYSNGSIHWIREGCYFNIEELKLKKLPPLDLPPDDSIDRLFELWTRRDEAADLNLDFVESDYELSSSDVSDIYFGESCGHLHYIDRITPQHLQFTIYEMKNDYSEWFIKHHVDLSSILATSPETKDIFPEIIKYDESDEIPRWSRRYHPLQVLSVLNRGLEDDKDTDTFLVLKVMGIFARYNVVSNTIKKLHQIEDRRLVRYSGFQYFESPGLV